jgi:hypothetical protein
MVMMPNNWSAIFKDAAGNNVFTAGGNESELTTDIKTGETFLFQALVQMEEQDMATQGSGCDVVPVRDTWAKAVINAAPFGIKDYEVARESVTQATLDAAMSTADNNHYNPPPKL